MPWGTAGRRSGAAGSSRGGKRDGSSEEEENLPSTVSAKIYKDLWNNVDAFFTKYALCTDTHAEEPLKHEFMNSGQTAESFPVTGYPKITKSKYFRTCSTGEHFTIEFENLVESDEGESPGSSQRPLTEEEIAALRARHYNSIAEKQRTLDYKLQSELAIQEEKLRIEEETLYAAQREAARAAKQKKLLEQQRLHRITQRAQLANSGDNQSSMIEEDFDTYLRNVKLQYEAFRSSRLSSDATVLTPNTESSCDLMTKTKSTSGNDDSNSLDLEWEDEEGMNRMIPLRERSKTEEDILRAALKFSGKKTGSNPTSASDDSNGLEWENDFVSAEMDDNGNSAYAGFVNPVLELSAPDKKTSDADQQDR